MAVKENKQMYEQAVQDLNASKGDVAKIRSALQKCCAPGFVNHNVRRGDMNVDQVSQYYAEFWATCPDFTVSIDDMVAEGDKLAACCTGRGTHKGTFMGISPTGKQVSALTMQIGKIEGGKFAEMWELPDTLGMMIQLGVVPDPAKSSVRL